MTLKLMRLPEDEEEEEEEDAKNARAALDDARFRRTDALLLLRESIFTYFWGKREEWKEKRKRSD